MSIFVMCSFHCFITVILSKRFYDPVQLFVACLKFFMLSADKTFLLKPSAQSPCALGWVSLTYMFFVFF